MSSSTSKLANKLKQLRMCPHKAAKIGTDFSVVFQMYGRFDDVTASEFLDIQMDLSELRLKWDNSTAQCHIIKAGFRTLD